MTKLEDQRSRVQATVEQEKRRLMAMDPEDREQEIERRITWAIEHIRDFTPVHVRKCVDLLKPETREAMREYIEFRLGYDGLLRH